MPSSERKVARLAVTKGACVIMVSLISHSPPPDIRQEPPPGGSLIPKSAIKLALFLLKYGLYLLANQS